MHVRNTIRGALIMNSNKNMVELQRKRLNKNCWRIIFVVVIAESTKKRRVLYAADTEHIEIINNHILPVHGALQTHTHTQCMADDLNCLDFVICSMQLAKYVRSISIGRWFFVCLACFVFNYSTSRSHAEQ